MSDLTRRMRKIIAPLSKQEERQVINSVNAHMQEQFKNKNGSRFRVLEILLKIDKPEKREALPQRLIRVLVADYDNKKNLEFVLDTRGKIIKLEEYRGLQPAFHKDEVKEARAIAERDDHIAHLAKKRGYFVSAFSPHVDFHTDSRILGLNYISMGKKGTDFQYIARILVDLSEKRLLSVEANEEINHQEQN